MPLGECRFPRRTVAKHVQCLGFNAQDYKMNFKVRAGDLGPLGGCCCFPCWVAVLAQLPCTASSDSDPLLTFILFLLKLMSGHIAKSVVGEV